MRVPSVITQEPTRLMIFEKAAAETGPGFVYGARALSQTGVPSGGQVVFLSLIDHPLGSVVLRAPTPLGVRDLEARAEDAKPARKGPTAKDREEAADRAFKVGVRGGVAVAAVEIVNAGGAKAAAPMFAKLYELPTDEASVDALAKSIEKITVAAPGSDVWKIVKLAVLVLTLFGLTPSAIRYLWGDDEPRWAWPVAYSLNAVIVAAVGLWLFDVWPFRAAPDQPIT